MPLLLKIGIYETLFRSEIAKRNWKYWKDMQMTNQRSRSTENDGINFGPTPSDWRGYF